jgi:hypothetical protein
VAPDWLISLNPGQDPNDASTNRRGFGIADGTGATKLFLDPAGNLGLGTSEPKAQLHVASGGVQIDGDLAVNGTVTLGTLGVDDRQNFALQVNGAINAARSDIYFTKKDHNHSGIGNTAGFAAIENASNFDALMLLGRAEAAHPTRPGVKLRVVKLWDFLDVNGEMRVTSNLSVSGEISAAGSELYFTKKDHNWDPKADAEGLATIQNGASHQALMIVGRAGAPHPIKPGVKLRVVKLWDFLDVNGEMRVTGAFLEVNGTGGERCYIGGDGGGGDVQIGSLNPGVQNLAAFNPARGYMTLFCAGTVQASDLSLKSNVTQLTGALDKVCALRGVRFDWKVDGVDDGPPDINSAQQIGLVAQEVEQVLPEVVTENRGVLGVSYVALIPLLIEAVKELQIRITRLESSALPGQRRSQDAST